MSSTVGDDAPLIHDCAQLEVLLALFTKECEIVSESEFHQEAIMQAYEAGAREPYVTHQWQSVLKQINRAAAYTLHGAAAKGRALNCCIELGFPLDEDVEDLVKSLIHDLDRLLHENSDCSCRLQRESTE